MSERLAGRVAVVTGAAHGIGLAYAHGLVECGAKVVVADIDGEAAEAAAVEVRRRGGDAVSVTTDVSEDASAVDLVSSAMDTYGRIDILINNAAMFARVPVARTTFDQITTQEWDDVMRVNVRGVWNVSRRVVPVMKDRGYGKIINVSSDTAYKPVRGFAHYVASKAAVVGLSQVMSQELGEFGIRVNCIAPTSVLSEEEVDEDLLEAKRIRAAGQAIQGILKPADLVGTVVFLASADSDFISGQTIMVNGGAAFH